MVALLARETLDTEQRCRLLQVVREQLLYTPRGALGIEMARPLGMIGPGVDNEVKITGLIANFPAERFLQINDRVIAIDGTPLIRADELVERVQVKKPGEIVSVTVKRPKVDDKGKWVMDENNQIVMDTLTFEFPLGSADVLDQRNRNIQSTPSRVQAERRRQALEITQACVPESESIRIKGGALRMAHEDEIDQHPAIVMLRAEQEQRIDADNTRRETWEQTLSALRQLANRPGLSDQERERIRRVAERYMQLMDAGS
jgi:hypothetical protein